jgi:hypothetical protein
MEILQKRSRTLMHISRCTSIPVLAAMVCFAVASTAHASPVTYSYLGLPFTSAGSPWTTSDFVSGSLTVSAPFAANLSLSPYAGGNSISLVTSYSLSDGLYTWSTSDSFVGDLNVSTNSNGTITAWDLTLLGNSGFPGSLLYLTGCAGCAPGGVTGDGVSNDANDNSSNNASGTWSLINPVSLTQQGGGSTAPIFLSAGSLVGAVTGNIGGQGSEDYYAFPWAGGAFSASASIPGGSLSASYLFSLGVTGTCGDAGSVTLNSGDGFTGTIAIPDLAPGQYCIGLDANSPSDPMFTLTFNTPVSSVPEPSSVLLLAIGVGVIGALKRRRNTGAPL